MCEAVMLGANVVDVDNMEIWVQKFDIDGSKCQDNEKGRDADLTCE
jgi:hypothetical protein